MANDEHFTERERNILLALNHGGDTDIDHLFKIIRGSDNERFTSRRKQQAIGSVVSALNRKLDQNGFGYQIKPGVARRTYRIVYE